MGSTTEKRVGISCLSSLSNVYTYLGKRSMPCSRSIMFFVIIKKKKFYTFYHNGKSVSLLNFY